MSVFLSHNHADKPIVRRVGLHLQRLGVRVWIDEAEIKAGDSLVETISRGVEASKFVLAFLSTNSINAKWVQKELQIASFLEIEGNSLKVIPVLLEKVQRPTFLIDKLYIDLTEDSFFESAIQKILEAIGERSAFVATRDSLAKLTFAGLAKIPSGLAAVGWTISHNDDFCYEDPDGARFPLRTNHLVVARRGQIRSLSFGRNRSSHASIRYEPIKSRLLFFQNFKSKPGTYGMTGCLWHLDLDPLRIAAVREVFSEENWGWHPVILADGTVEHFAYSGYRKIHESEDLGPWTVPDADKCHVAHHVDVSGEIFPNSSEYIAEAIIKIVDGADNA